MKDFLSLFSKGKISDDEIDDYIDFWHDSELELGTLYEFLGFNWKEWCSYIEGKKTIPEIAKEKHKFSYLISKFKVTFSRVLRKVKLCISKNK